MSEIYCNTCLWWIAPEESKDGYGACTFNAPTDNGFSRTHMHAYCRRHSNLDEPASINAGRLVPLDRDENGQSKTRFM